MEAISTAIAMNTTNATIPSAPRQALPAMSGVNKATDANGLPTFGQIVRDVLNRTTASSGPERVASSRAEASPKATGPAGNAPRPGTDASKADVSSAAISIHLVLLPNLPVPLPLQALSLDAQNVGNEALATNPPTGDGGTQAGVTAAGSTTDENAGAPVASTASSDPRNGGPTAQDIGTALIQQIVAQLSNALSVPTFPTVGSAQPAGTPVASGSTTVPSEGAAAPVGNPQTKASVVQIAGLAPAGPNPQPAASLLPQILQLQLGVAGAHSATPAAFNAPVPSAFHVLPEQSGALTHAAVQFAAARLAVPAAPSAAPKGFPPVVEEGKTNAPVQASSSSADQAASQDAGANHKEPGHADAAGSADGSSSVPSAHDAMSFSGALASANSKPDASQAPAAATTLVTGAELPASDRAANSSGSAPQPAPAPAPPPSFQGTEAAATRFVNNAQLVEAASHSEMRIAMDTDKLGAVELRAHIVGDEVGAAIMVEKRDAHALLAVELPALQQALSDKQLRIEQVTLLHGSFSATAGDAGSSAKQDARNASHAATHANPGSWLPNGPGGMPSMFASAEASGIFDSQGRLSVHV